MCSCVPLLRSRYGAHLSKEQVAELVAPHSDTLKLVHSWLEYHGIPSSSISVTHGGSSLKLTGVSVSRANDLLGASYQLYRHVKTNETMVRTVGYALPAALHAHVQTVEPTSSFDSPHPQWQTPRKRLGGVAVELAEAASGEPVTVPSRRDDKNHDGTTPSFLSSLYSTSAYSPAATDKNMIGIVGFLGQYPSPTDLTLFMNKYRSNGADATFTALQANGGGYDPGNPHAEPNLDIQYSQGMTYPTRQLFYSTGRGPTGTKDEYLSWLEYIINQPSIPQTISIAYGHDEKIYPRLRARFVCSLFAQLGARGVSVLFSSGDDGVGEGDCKDGSGNVRFIPIFPATCTCGLFSWLASSTQARVRVTHHTAALP